MSDEIILKADNKTSAIKEIIAITPDNSAEITANDLANPALALEKTTVKVIRETHTSYGYPCKYALIDNTEDNFTIELDYTPDVNYDETDEPDKRLIVNYYPNYRILGDNSEYAEFEDYDEANMNKGNWKLPSDWHKLIVEGAMAMLYPEMKEKWEMDCKRKKEGQYLNAGMKLKGFLGVSNRSGRR